MALNAAEVAPDSAGNVLAALDARYAGLPSAGKNKLTGWFHVDGFGAKGDGSTSDTAAITAAIAAVPSTGGVLYFPTGTYLCANLTLNKNNVTVLMDAGATLKKNAHGPVLSWGSGGFTRLEGRGLRIDGNGANYTGPGLVINGGTFPRLDGGEISNTQDNPLQFVGSGAGHSARVSDMILFAYDAFAGGTRENVAAISLPLDGTQAPNRHFSNIHAAGTLLFTDAGSQDSNFVACTARNVAHTGTPSKQFLVSCRLASGGAGVTLRGVQSQWVASAFAGPVTVHGASANSSLVGCSGAAGGLTIASGAVGIAHAGNTWQGEVIDLGYRTHA